MFIDRASEKGMPAFGQLLERVGQNDLVKVPSMFDLGATMSQIVDSINQISEKGARIWINNDERILDAESEFFRASASQSSPNARSAPKSTLRQ